MASSRPRAADPATLARRRRRLGAGAIALVALVVAVASGGGGVGAPPAPGLGHEPSGYPFTYSPARADAFVQRAIAGSGQVLFTKSPGGALQTAARVANFRPLIDAAVRGTSIDPNLVEVLVFVESAGRPDVIAGGTSDPANAAGLTQILATTGQSLLGMHIDLSRSRALSAEIDQAVARGQGARVVALERRRAQIDTRFDPGRALAATVRYLRFALGHFGARQDLAFESYHMGVGNLTDVLGLYDGGVAVPYAQLYFDSTPLHHPAAYRLLASFGDDSSLYWWKLLGAEQVMRLYRRDRAALQRLTTLEVSYPSSALVLHPPGSVEAYADPAALSAAYSSGTLVALPRNAGALHLAYAPQMGTSTAGRLGVPAALYRGLRPAALRMLIEIAALVHRISGVSAPLTVSSTVSEARSDAPASTGWTFQIERRYASPAQADAFQFTLDRLQALNLIAWLREPATIEITVAGDAARVLAHGV